LHDCPSIAKSFTSNVSPDSNEHNVCSGAVSLQADSQLVLNQERRPSHVL